ncbi:MAG TPA: type II secretion system protein [Kofleriaceae bacterium]|nr:type II secretion system protein [Kofleriaceae bacterium]
MSATRERGFTLTELLITVALIGVLTTLAVAVVRSSPQPVDVASQVSSKLAETSRKAITYGSVRGDVAAALGSKSRTRAVFTSSATGVTIGIDRLEEAAFPSASATWIPMSTARVHRDVTLRGYTASAMLSNGTTPAVTLGTTGRFEVYCRPDGTCDGITIYLVNKNGAKKARVVMLPLGGTPMTFPSW